jgi:hypothetical protein
MRKATFLGAAAIALMAATTANAQNYVGVSHGNIKLDGFDDEQFTAGELAIAGANHEIDLAIVSGDSSDEVAVSVAGHLFTRTDSHLFGGFVGFGTGDDVETWTAGVEGNKYFEHWTLAAAVGYTSDEEADLDGYGINTEARLFPADNFRLQFNLAWADVDDGTPGGGESVLGYGLGAEYQISGSPISLTLNLDRAETEDTDVEVSTYSFGIRYNWGGTLKERDRSGASQASLIGFAGF